MQCSAALRLVLRRSASKRIHARGLSMVHKEERTPIAPGHEITSVPPPPKWKLFDEEVGSDPNAYVRKPPTSAYAVDSETDALSESDAVVVTSGGVRHGKHGVLPVEPGSSVPLEYLALADKAAEGCAALRLLGSPTSGTVLIYGASRVPGLSALQLATANGLRVAGVVDGGHSGSDEMVDVVKHMAVEPGFAVQEEYALVKKNFADLVKGCVEGVDPEDEEKVNQELFLEDFKANAVEYSLKYPDSLPAAIDPEDLEFVGKDKDRENFKENWDAYLEQFGMTSPPIDPASLDKNFDKNSYQSFKDKFHAQNTSMITLEEDPPQFSPPKILADAISQPSSEKLFETRSDVSFSTLNPPATSSSFPPSPIIGAIVHATPELKTAMTALEKCKTKREKAEALQFLTDAERNAHAAAASVAGLATKVGAKVLVVGGTLPGMTSAETTLEDVKTTLEAMEIQDVYGTSKLNLFIQAYRAGDYPVYEDYAIHRAKEPLAGPREIVVTK